MTGWGAFRQGARNATLPVHMTVTVKSNATGLVVPPSVRRRAGIKPGDRLEFKVSGGIITITSKPPSADDYTPGQRRSIDRGLNQSLKEYQQGKSVGPFDTAEEFLADLHKESAKLSAKKTKRARK